jgi:hypothetical protein
MERYSEYLRFVYKKMARHVKPSDVVMEICTRHDRGVLGKEALPHKQYIMVDRNSSRLGLNLDAVRDELPPCDVVISTAILHHTRPEDIEALFCNLAKNTRSIIILSGPNVDILPELFGDHLYHIDKDHIHQIESAAGWRCIEVSPCGLSEPFCELFLVFERKPT